MLLSRLVWLVTGLVWAARSVIGFAGPDYWDPVTTLDFASIWVYTLAWVLLAPSVLLIARLVPSRSVAIAATIVAIGAVMAGGANALEDALEIGSMGTWYVVGFMTGWLGLLVLALALGRAGRSRLAGLVMAIFAGLLLFILGGGLLILAALGSLAAAPESFTRDSVSSESATASPATQGG